MWKGRWAAILTIILVMSLVSMGGLAYGERKQIIISEFNNSGSIVICQIMKHVLEGRLDVPVTVKRFSPGEAWSAMVEGKVDVYSDLWWPDWATPIQQYVHDRKVVELTLSYDNARQGFLIPTWVSNKYGIARIEDLNKHTKLFDLGVELATSSPGGTIKLFEKPDIGDLWVGEYGWLSTEINKIKMTSYRLNYDPLVADHWVFLGILNHAMKTQKPIIFYYLSPDWIFGRYDLTWIKEPKYESKKWRYVEKHPERSRIRCEYRRSKVYVGYSSKLKSRVPKAYKFFKNWYFSLDEMSSLIAEIEDVPENPRKDPAEVAKNWVEAHPEIVNDWLKGIK